MLWITQEDLKAQIKLDLLDKITSQDAYILATVEAIAIAETKAYLTKYDTQQVFATTGTDRNALLVMIVIDIALYHLHSRLNPNQVPEIRQKRYDEAKNVLDKIADGKISLELPFKKEEETQIPLTKFRWGSEPKRQW